MIYGIIDVATIATITTRIITAAIFRVCFGLNTFFHLKSHICFHSILFHFFFQDIHYYCQMLLFA